MIDSGMAVRLMTAVRHSKRNAIRMSTTQDAADEHRVLCRLCRASSMKLAGRKIFNAISTPARLGRRASMAFSVP